MKIGQIVKSIKKGEGVGAYFIAGEEAFLHDYAQKSIIAALGIENAELNVLKIPEEAEFKDIERLCESVPFMSEKKAVCGDISLLNADTQKKLAAYLPEKSYFTVLLLHKYSAAEKKKALEKKLVEGYALADCGKPDESTAADFICARAAKAGKGISRGDAKFLHAYAGGDLNNVINELDKLIAVSDTDITQEDVKKYAVISDEYNIFLLHELMLGGQNAEAYELCAKILQNDKSPIGLISLLAGNFEAMLIARACADARYTDAKIVKTLKEKLKLSDYRAKKAIAQCAKLSAQDIRRARRKLAQADFNAKQGALKLETDLFGVLADIYNP